MYGEGSKPQTHEPHDHLYKGIDNKSLLENSLGFENDESISKNSISIGVEVVRDLENNYNTRQFNQNVGDDERKVYNNVDLNIDSNDWNHRSYTITFGNAIIDRSNEKVHDKPHTYLNDSVHIEKTPSVTNCYVEGSTTETSMEVQSSNDNNHCLDDLESNFEEKEGSFTDTCYMVQNYLINDIGERIENNQKNQLIENLFDNLSSAKGQVKNFILEESQNMDNTSNKLRSAHHQHKNNDSLDLENENEIGPTSEDRIEENNGVIGILSDNKYNIQVDNVELLEEFNKIKDGTRTITNYSSISSQIDDELKPPSKIVYNNISHLPKNINIDVENTRDIVVDNIEKSSNKTPSTNLASFDQTINSHDEILDGNWIDENQ